MNLNKSLQVKAELKRLLHSSTGCVPLREAADTTQLRKLMSTLDTSRLSLRFSLWSPRSRGSATSTESV